MKKTLLLTVVSTLILSVFTSCSKEVVYSCDKDVNEWTKSNMEAIKVMDRNDWSHLEHKYQQGAYVAFNQNQRMDLWKSKIEETLSFDWSAKEKAHIASLVEIIEKNPSWFAETLKDNEAEKDNMTLTMYRWIEYATDTLNWNNDLIYAFIGAPQKMLNKAGELEGTVLTKAGPSGPAGASCNCNVNSDWCRNSNCNSQRCNAVTVGCGTFWMTDCNGVCS